MLYDHFVYLLDSVLWDERHLLNTLLGVVSQAHSLLPSLCVVRGRVEYKYAPSPRHQDTFPLSLFSFLPSYRSAAIQVALLSLSFVLSFFFLFPFVFFSLCRSLAFVMLLMRLPRTFFLLLFLPFSCIHPFIWAPARFNPDAARLHSCTSGPKEDETELCHPCFPFYFFSSLILSD